jgi:hypothetical protein
MYWKTKEFKRWTVARKRCHDFKKYIFAKKISDKNWRFSHELKLNYQNKHRVLRKTPIFFAENCRKL